MHEVLGGHRQDRTGRRDQGDRTEEKVQRRHGRASGGVRAGLFAAVTSCGSAEFGSSAGGGGTVVIHCPSLPFSCSRSRTLTSAYSNSGLQCRASNGQTSMQMPQYMHNEKSMAKRSSTLR